MIEWETKGECVRQQTSQEDKTAIRSMSTHVMVIDDSPTTRKILETCLGRAGYQVASFPDGVKALRWLLAPGARLPDLVLLDITMPGMDGYAVAQYLKTRPPYRHIPIVMLSGRHGVLDRLKARLAGAQQYLTKPFRTESILATVQAYLGPALVLDAASINTDRDMNTLNRDTERKTAHV